jgi:uncharacterized protein YPO0396
VLSIVVKRISKPNLSTQNHIEWRTARVCGSRGHHRGLGAESQRRQPYDEQQERLEATTAIRIREISSIESDALHRENTELKARLEHTLSTLAKADHNRKEQLKEISTQLKNVTAELHETREERNALKLKLKETEAKLHSKLREMET